MNITKLKPKHQLFGLVLDLLVVSIFWLLRFVIASGHGGPFVVLTIEFFRLILSVLAFFGLCLFLLSLHFLGSQGIPPLHHLKQLLRVANANFLVLLIHFINVTLQLLGNIDAEHKDFVTVSDVHMTGWVCVDVRVQSIISSSFESIECQADELLAQEKMEEVLEVVAHALPGDRNLPEVRLGQVGVSLHRLPQLLILFFRSTFENLLENVHYVLVIV